MAGSGWDWEAFKPFLPPPILMYISVIHPSSTQEVEDSFYWKHSPNGSFTMASSYTILLGRSERHSQGDWPLMWKWCGPEPVRTFSWLPFHGALLTNQKRKQRHMADETNCGLCEEEVKRLSMSLGIVHLRIWYGEVS
ncbi:hypothetical protein Scep_026457 [Stephania cephalantha]|uniref:Reverse transcriptase zinc-binding domain-containing protein n=1 Tax=Stephania cephalantha TaxID=152367 RepID=A0AAP0ESG3_9MAGN